MFQGLSDCQQPALRQHPANNRTATSLFAPTNKVYTGRATTPAQEPPMQPIEAPLPLTLPITRPDVAA